MCQQNDCLILQRNSIIQLIIQVNENICHFYDDKGLMKHTFQKMSKKEDSLAKSSQLVALKSHYVLRQNAIFQKKLSLIPEMAQKILAEKEKLLNLEKEFDELSGRLEEMEGSENINLLAGVDPSPTELSRKLTVME